jgi:hypothetical protein
MSEALEQLQSSDHVLNTLIGCVKDLDKKNGVDLEQRVRDLERHEEELERRVDELERHRNREKEYQETENREPETDKVKKYKEKRNQGE